MAPSINSADFVVVDPVQQNYVALIIDEQNESLTSLSQSFAEQSFRVVSSDSLAVLDNLSADIRDSVRAIALSLSLPGMDSPGVLSRLVSLFPLVPFLLIGPGAAAEQALDRAPATIRLDRPVQTAEAAKATDCCRHQAEAFEELVQREVFLRHASYIEEPIARIIHDINNQMTGLKGGIDLLSYSVDMIRDPDTQAKLNRYMEQFIQPSLAQIEQLVANWRRLRENRSRPHIATDLVQTLRHSITLAANPAQQAKVTLRVQGNVVPIHSGTPIPSHRYHVHANPEQLALALGYIVQNAVEAVEGREDGRVLVEIDSAEDDMCRVRIYDNGEGIPESIRPQIWRSFFTTKGDWRNGLGLSIAKQIIDKHQGQVECIHSPLGGAGIQVLFAMAEAFPAFDTPSHHSFLAGDGLV